MQRGVPRPPVTLLQEEGSKQAFCALAADFITPGELAQVWKVTFLKNIYGPFKRSLLNLLQYCFCFLFGEVCEILAPQPGIKPAPPALEGEVLTTGPEGGPEDALI